MFQFKRDFTDAYRKHRSLEESRRLNPELKSLAQWLGEHAAKIPMPQ